MAVVLSRKPGGAGGGGGGPPSGPAGGDLTGTYPNPTIAAGAAEAGACMAGYPEESRSVTNIGTTNAFAVRVWIPFKASFSTYLFYCGNATGNMDLGIYDAAGAAVTREGSFAIPGTGRQTRTITGGPVTLTAGEYILAMQKNNAASTFGIIASTGCELIALTPANTFPLPDPLPLTVGGTGVTLSIIT